MKKRTIDGAQYYNGVLREGLDGRGFVEVYCRFKGYQFFEGLRMTVVKIKKMIEAAQYYNGVLRVVSIEEWLC